MLLNWSVRVSRPWVVYGELKLLALRCRCGADPAKCGLDVLALHGPGDVGRRQVEGARRSGSSHSLSE